MSNFKPIIYTSIYTDPEECLFIVFRKKKGVIKKKWEDRRKKIKHIQVAKMLIYMKVINVLVDLYCTMDAAHFPGPFLVPKFGQGR